MIPIRSLRCGECAIIRHLDGPLDKVRRLEEIGIRHGARLELVRGGSTCIIRVAGSTLCFRNDDSVSVLVSPRMTA